MCRSIESCSELDMLCSYIIRTNLYGGKLHSYGVTVKTGSGPASWVPASYAYVAIV